MQPGAIKPPGSNAAYSHRARARAACKYICAFWILASGCSATYPVVVERTIEGHAVRQTLYLLDTDWQSEQNERALNLVFEKKDWPGALAVWTFMSEKKLALDCGLLSNLAVAEFMTGKDAFRRAEHALRYCDDSTIRRNFRIITAR